MDVSRSMVVKTILARDGPKTMHQLYVTARNTFPEQFEGISATQFKKKYVRNLVKTKQITIKPSIDLEVLDKLRKDPTSRVGASKKQAWLFKISKDLETAFSNPNYNPDPNHSEILQKIEGERKASRNFWEGKSNSPHDWREIIRATGAKID
ncbi:hypothetical protein LPJ72_002218 [Coemansia sp. Benny D160-2]|nr:hypothetical protein LPJ72_002218 [Coemansia sp. Benny D160-2]